MDSPIVSIKDGKIKGKQTTNLDGEKFYSFLGIPYAKTPIGELRFKAPEPIDPWTGVKDATEEGDACFHKHEYLFKLHGSENCLHLNVFSKTLPSEEKKLKPVMVYIHGGGFMWGSNSLGIYGPKHLMLEDIVLVTLNYRFGVLGFLRLEDPSLDIPGNAGLKDQQLALKWVQRNIINFNGDPNNVTLFGESAGSASVHYHIVSPSSKGLFHKALMQSGTSFNPWTSAYNPTMEFVQSIKKDVENEKQALEVLRDMNVEELYQKQQEFCALKGIVGVFGPTIEKPNGTAFLTSSPADIISSGQYNKVPMLLGYNNGEGLIFEGFNLMSKANGEEPPFKDINEDNLEFFIHPHMKLASDDPRRKTIGSKLKEFYFKEKKPANQFLLIGDYMFMSGIIGTAKLHARTSPHPVYLYRMSLEAGMNIARKFTKIQEPGVLHADDLGYIFDVPVLDAHLQRGDLENAAIRRFVKMWTNFAKTGNPTPQGNDLNVSWKPINQSEINFLEIGEILKLKTDPEGERMKIWKEIYQLSEATLNYL